MQRSSEHDRPEPPALSDEDAAPADLQAAPEFARELLDSLPTPAADMVLAVTLQDLHARAAGYATRARGPGTLRTYRSA